MKADTRPLNISDVESIAIAMRESDRREIFATRFDDDPVMLAMELLAGDPIGAVIAAADGTAVAVVAATEMWPGNWSVWMFATERWPDVARAATHFARKVLGPAMIRLGGRRAECRSAAHHHAAHRWLRHLGGKAEAIYPAYGRNGETFIGFVFYGENNMCASPNKPKPVVVKPQADPEAANKAAAEAADQEVRRLRALSGRSSTILTPGAEQLGSAPIGGSHLLGS